MTRLGEFQPPDAPDEDIDAKWEAWFDQQEKNGYAVISRDEWKQKLDEAASIGYADGRKDEREEWEARILPLLIELHDSEVLSEQQCARLFGVGLLGWRMASQPAPHPFAPEGDQS